MNPRIVKKIFQERISKLEKLTGDPERIKMSNCQKFQGMITSAITMAVFSSMKWSAVVVICSEKNLRL